MARVRTRLAGVGIGVGLAGVAVGAFLAAPLERSDRGREPWDRFEREEGPEPAGAEDEFESLEDEVAEESDHAGRAAWIAAMHAGPPGYDWVARERANALAQRDKRNRLATTRAGDTSRWTERGSDNNAGRVWAAARSTDGERLYVGTDNGGVWVGTIDGDDWAPIGDALWGGAQHLAVVGGTGGDVVLAATNSGSVHRSADGGTTWTTPGGLEELDAVRRVVVTTSGEETIFLLGHEHGDYLLFRSIDAAATFAAVADLGDYAGDVWVPRDGGSSVYLLDDDALRVSTDGGTNFDVVGSSPGGSSAVLAGSEAGAPRFWAASDGDLYRSDDLGATWEPIARVDDFYGTLGASIVDEDLVVYAGVELHRSDDGGERFETQSDWWLYDSDPAKYLHADIWSLGVMWDGPGDETWYVATDGGLFRSNDSFWHVHNLSLVGLHISQYYGTHTSTANPANIVAGAQDQGYQASMGSGDGLLDFDILLSGDYGHLTSGDGTHGYLFSVYPGFLLAAEGEEDPTLEYLDFPPGETYSWLPPVVADPEAPEDVFFAGQHLYRYHHTRSGWDTERASDQDFSRGGGYISALAFSPIDPELAFVATSGGQVYWSEDHGVTWEHGEGHIPDAQYWYGNTLCASALDAKVVYLGGGGYGRAAVYRSEDGGRTYDAWGEGLPDTMVYALVEVGDGRVYAATETAVYERGPRDAAWVDVTGDDAPVTIYWGAEFVPSSNVVRFATYGRGIWDYAVPDQDEACGLDVDGDADGVVCAGDCDDSDPDVRPGALDTCGDGIDRDCDGADCVPLPEVPGGCGCDTGGGSGAALGLIAAALVRRRRR